MNSEQPYPKRRNARLPAYDYSQPGAYFITICTYARRCLFGDIVNWQVRLTANGEAVRQELRKSFEVRKEMTLDAWVIMPNHIHAIVFIGEGDSQHAPGDLPVAPTIIGEDADAPQRSSGDLPVAPTTAPKRPGPRQRSLSSLVGGFKAAATRKIRQSRVGGRNFIWQRGYYEHVIRNEAELRKLRDYVAGNPSRWFEDSQYPENLARMPDNLPKRRRGDP